MYSLLTPIRYVLNPRFQLTSPLQSGLFYIAPGCGYLFGTFFGGRYADHIVKKYIRKRGKRVAEDRLRSCVLFLGGVIPACMIIYGWSVEKAVGGVALPVLMMFLQGVAQLFCFPSLNVYCLDVMQERSAEVIGKSRLSLSLICLKLILRQRAITSCATCSRLVVRLSFFRLSEAWEWAGSRRLVRCFSWRVRRPHGSLQSTARGGATLLMRRRLRERKLISKGNSCLAWHW